MFGNPRHVEQNILLSWNETLMSSDIGNTDYCFFRPVSHQGLPLVQATGGLRERLEQSWSEGIQSYTACPIARDFQAASNLLLCIPLLLSTLCLHVVWVLFDIGITNQDIIDPHHTVAAPLFINSSTKVQYSTRLFSLNLLPQTIITRNTLLAAMPTNAALMKQFCKPRCSTHGVMP